MDVQLVATSCFFLACKVEEQPHKLENIVRTKLKMARLPSGQEPKLRDVGASFYGFVCICVYVCV
jgi:hypothetical protein